jgi:hypothetical protein
MKWFTWSGIAQGQTDLTERNFILAGAAAKRCFNLNTICKMEVASSCYPKWESTFLSTFVLFLNFQYRAKNPQPFLHSQRAFLRPGLS